MGGTSIDSLHAWDVTPAEARQIQRELAGRVSRRNEVGEVRSIAGVDVAVGRGNGPARAAAVLLEHPGLDVLESRRVEAPIRFPYIPGLLSFREAPLVIEAVRQLTRRPDLVLIDGQGLAHPRRFGLACHVGLLLDMPTIGCAKSRLIGVHEPVGDEPGAWTPLLDAGEPIGAVVRTKRNSKPIYVSIGHKVDLQAAVEWVLRCCRGYRLPEPTRLADRAAGGKPLVA